MTPAVVTASRAEQEPVLSVITLAFTTDPMARWAHADPAGYLSHMPAVADALGGSAFDHATAYCIEGHLGAALWLPPGAHPDHEALGALVERTGSRAEETIPLRSFGSDGALPSGRAALVLAVDRH